MIVKRPTHTHTHTHRETQSHKSRMELYSPCKNIPCDIVQLSQFVVYGWLNGVQPSLLSSSLALSLSVYVCASVCVCMCRLKEKNTKIIITFAAKDFTEPRRDSHYRMAILDGGQFYLNHHHDQNKALLPLDRQIQTHTKKKEYQTTKIELNRIFVGF